MAYGVRKDISCANPDCRGPIKTDRNPPYCCKVCEAAVEGYKTEGWAFGGDKNRLRSLIEASTAWAPAQPEPAKHLVTGYPVAIAGDIHCPIQCARWTEQFLLTAEKFEARTCILNGDLINADQIGRFMGGEFRRRATLEDDMDAAEKFVGLMCSVFDEVYYTLGNHTGRLIKMAEGELSIQRLLKMIYTSDKMKVSAKTWMYLNKNTRVLHPRAYSQIRGKLTSELAQLYQCHLITGHHHHTATTISKDAKWQAVEHGCLANIQLMTYVQDNMNNMPFMANGFCVSMPDEKILNFNQFTHWKSFGLPELRVA